jgi:ABC-2 type transport system ATP-binding protein
MYINWRISNQKKRFIIGGIIMYYIEAHNVSKTIKHNEVLKNVTLQLEKNKVHAFIGRNGSGKTMFFRAVCGLIRPAEGYVTIDGKKVGQDIDFPESVGVIIESCGFWDQYTGFENLKIIASIKGIATDEIIQETLDRVGLDYKDKRKYKAYSLGMKQRLAIAQAIMEKPELLVLDEPTNGLDESGVELIRAILLEEKARGATLLIASHNKEDIQYLADYTYKVDSGIITKLVDEVKV